MKLSKPEKFIIAVLVIIVILTICFFIISDLNSPKLAVTRITYEQNISDDPSRIDINTATLEQLKSLKGIGEGIAGKIIDYRENKHPFSVPSDIMNVDGVGPGIYEEIKDQICVR